MPTSSKDRALNAWREHTDFNGEELLQYIEANAHHGDLDADDFRRWIDARVAENLEASMMITYRLPEDA